MSYDIQISGDALATLPKLRDAEGLGHALARTMDEQNQYTIAHILRDYVSFPKDGPTWPLGLRTISGRLRGSIVAAKAVPTATGVESSIGSNVVYAKIHEEGFSGTETVAAHTRRQFTTGKALFGKKTKIARVHTGDIQVRSFTRNMHMPARRPIGHGIEDRLADYGAAFDATILRFWRNQN